MENLVTIAAIVVFLVLLAAALMHAAWALGMCWPAADEPALAETVIGTPGMTRMPGTGVTLAVAAAIFTAGLFAIAGAGLIVLPLPGWMTALALPFLALVFGLRGAATYVVGQRWPRSEPFATLDRRYFAPLCLATSLGFVIILLVR